MVRAASDKGARQRGDSVSDGPFSLRAYGAACAASSLGPLQIKRRALGARDGVSIFSTAVSVMRTSTGLGGIAESQEVIDYCAARNITADIELIRPDQINHADERVVKKDVRYRFMTDLATEKKERT